MRITKIVLKEFEELIALQCDICRTKYHDQFEIQEFIKIHHHCGYGTVFEDEQVITIDICQHCFKEKIFSISKKEQ